MIDTVASALLRWGARIPVSKELGPVHPDPRVQSPLRDGASAAAAPPSVLEARVILKV
jgi:hypothetical protein